MLRFAVICLLDLTEGTTHSVDFFIVGLVVGAGGMLALCFRAVKEYIDNHYWKHPEDPATRIENLARPFLDHRFIMLLVMKIEQGGNPDLINTITVTKSETKIVVFNKPEPVIIPHKSLHYADLQDDDLLPVACALLLNLGSQYEAVYDENKELTPTIHRKPPTLRQLNPVKNTK